MKRIRRTPRLALAALAICSQMTPAISEDAEEIVWASTMSSWESRGQGFSCSISDRDLAGSPAWPGPEDGEPSLTMAQAIAISKQKLAKYSPETTDWILEGIEIRSLGRDGRWYYRISWTEADGAGGRVPGGNLFIPVSMSGKVFTLERDDGDGGSHDPETTDGDLPEDRPGT